MMPRTTQEYKLMWRFYGSYSRYKSRIQPVEDWRRNFIPNIFNRVFGKKVANTEKDFYKNLYMEQLKGLSQSTQTSIGNVRATMSSGISNKTISKFCDLLAECRTKEYSSDQQALEDFFMQYHKLEDTRTLHADTVLGSIIDANLDQKDTVSQFSTLGVGLILLTQSGSLKDLKSDEKTIFNESNRKFNLVQSMVIDNFIITNNKMSQIIKQDKGLKLILELLGRPRNQE